MTRKSVRGLALSGALFVISGGALLLTPGCGEVETQEPADTADSDSEDVGTAESELASCVGTGDVATVTNAIAANCGGVSGCMATNSTHNDLRLTDPSKYCSCYEWLWSKRALAPYKNVQIIYHNAAAGQCGSNYHIHVQKKNGFPACATTCNNGMQGLIAMDLDTSSADHFDAEGNPDSCVDNGGSYDRAYDCSCAATESKQSGACVNPGAGGGWNCASSAYNGAQYWTCSGGNLHKCVSGVPQTQTCANGCNVNAVGTDDTCKSAGINWNCASSAYNGAQYWTCSSGNLYKCVNGVPQKTTCANGCNVMALGTNDTCK